MPLVLCSTLALGTAAHGATILHTNAAWPSGPNVETVDVHSLSSINGHGLTGTRQIRQTFQNPEEFIVGYMYLSASNWAGNIDFILRIYEVDFIEAGTWADTGASLFFETTVTASGLAVAGPSNLMIGLDPSEWFTLPQRDSGTTGHAMELETVGNTGSAFGWNHAFDGTDHAPGRYYNESGAGQNLDRDMGLALVVLPEPGSVALLGVGAGLMLLRRRRRSA